MAQFSVIELTTENQAASPWVASGAPRLSWKTRSKIPNWIQEGAEIEVSVAGQVRTTAIEGRDSVDVPWPGAPLTPRQNASVRVRTSHHGEWSDWSVPLAIRAGHLGAGGWVAAFIDDGEGTTTPLRLRRSFIVREGLRSATLYATATGVYQAEVNGVEVDDQVLKPGWTPYRKRLIHETTDVTGSLRAGGNAIGVTLAGGWYTENYGFLGFAKPFYGTSAAFAGQLVLEYEDGVVETVATDETWSVTATGPLKESGIYRGEHYDARDEELGWTSPGFVANNGWHPASLTGTAHPTPTSRNSPAARRIEEVAVTEVITSPTGKTLLDFGQNLVGRLRITVSGPAGTVITLRHAEVLEDDELGTRPLRYADATDSYTLSGVGIESWEPEFTFHGFRYAEITGWPGSFAAESVTAVVLHSDMARSGWFESSNELLNQLHSNVVWGMRGNFLYLPTDCPQRDERLGWTGDIQVFAPTASYLYDVNSFLSSWLEDLALEQASDGRVPFIVPDVLGSVERPAAAWGDAATVVPWTLYERFGNTAVLAQQFDSMRGWVDHLLGIAGDRNLWEGRFQFGDWLDPDAPADRPGDAKTDPDIVASAYLFRSTDLLARTARVLGRIDLAAHYSALAEGVRNAWLAEYVTTAGRIVSDAQTAYALAIVFDIATDDHQRAAMGARLAWLVRRDGYKIRTGFVGTPLVQDALVTTGHSSVAARLTLQTENPSWLYPVTMGATTIWERWDSMLEDGSINPGEMTSFNHYALGAIADWLHRRVGGLAAAEPGYATLKIYPVVLPGLTHATTTHETPYGSATVGWRVDGERVKVTAEIPANTTAVVSLDDGSESFSVGSGVHEWSYAIPADVPIARAPLSLSSPLSDIIDDPEAHRAVIDVVTALDPDRAELLKRHTKWIHERPLIGEFEFVEPSVISAVGDVLAELEEARAHG